MVAVWGIAKKTFMIELEYQNSENLISKQNSASFKMRYLFFRFFHVGRSLDLDIASIIFAVRKVSIAPSMNFFWSFIASLDIL